MVAFLIVALITGFMYNYMRIMIFILSNVVMKKIVNIGKERHE